LRGRFQRFPMPREGNWSWRKRRGKKSTSKPNRSQKPTADPPREKGKGTSTRIQPHSVHGYECPSPLAEVTRLWDYEKFSKIYVSLRNTRSNVGHATALNKLRDKLGNYESATVYILHFSSESALVSAFAVQVDFGCSVSSRPISSVG